MRLAPHRSVSPCELYAFRKVTSAALVLCTLTALSFAAPSVCAQNSAQPKPAAALRPASTTPATRQSADGPHEGIKVHGHWVIEVKNPDGRVTARREFENKLEGLEGAQVIMNVLSGEAVKGQWMIALPVPCSSASFCVLGEGGDPAPQSVPIATDLTSAFGGAASLDCQSAPSGACAQTLVLTINNPIGTLVLTGSVVAGNSGSIGAVETANQECYGSINLKGQISSPPGFTVAQCEQFVPSDVQYFTGTTLTPAQSFSAGQTITVTVTISFQ